MSIAQPRTGSPPAKPPNEPQCKNGEPSGSPFLLSHFLLNRACRRGKDIVGVRADESYGTYDNHENDRKHHCALSDVLAFFVDPSLGHVS
jgi:hypothetical protein